MSGNLPKPVRGVYLLCADNREKTLVPSNELGPKDAPQPLNTDPDWHPWCKPPGYKKPDGSPDPYAGWIQQFNVVWLTFIDGTAKVPKAIINAAKYRGSNGLNLAPNTKVIFSMGGYAYSQYEADLFSWLDTKEDAEAKADYISGKTGYDGYEYADGFDFDVEPLVCTKPHVLDFIRQLRKNKPNWIITQPVLGDPSNCKGGVSVAVTTWYKTDKFAKSGFPWMQNLGPEPKVSEPNLYDSLGLMAYSTTQPNDTYQGYYSGKTCNPNGDCRIGSAIPPSLILHGITPGKIGDQPDPNVKNQSDLDAIWDKINQGMYGGYMVWFAAADNGFVYNPSYLQSFNPPLNWRGSKPIFYSCQKQGFGCSQDESCTQDDGDKCFSDIQQCNDKKNCGPFFGCRHPKNGCENSNCDPSTDSKNCFRDLESCNRAQNCVNLYKCLDKTKGCEINSECSFEDSKCHESKSECDSNDNCFLEPTKVKCKWYQQGTYEPDCKNPSCAQAVEGFSSIKKSKSARILFLILLGIIGIFAVSQIFKNLKGESMVQIFMILLVIVLVASIV